MTQRTIEAVLQEYTPKWMALDGVVGTGIGECDGKPCIKIMVARQSGTLARQTPKDVEGYRVVIEVTGEFRAR